MNNARSPAQGPDDAALRRLGAEFRSATGLPVVFTDQEGRQTGGHGGCPLCARMARSRKREEICRAHRRTAVAEAVRWGEPFISLCPFGLVTFTVPLFHERLLSGGVVSGFCVFPEMEADIRDEVTERIRHLGIRFTLPPRARLHLRALSSERLRQSARMLFDLVTAYGMSDPERIAE
ncbi:MAG TPA: PocR ligand-binding domain-containing protein, partial [bacterium]|nr:PocR ligand-binding domain-containing protein [bacterium]